MSDSVTASSSTEDLVSDTGSRSQPPQAAPVAAASRMKRNREAALGPSTPRSEGDETKILGGAATPLHKKGRVVSDSLNDTNDDSAHDSNDNGTNSRSLPTSDQPEPVDQQEDDSAQAGKTSSSSKTSRKRTTPPPGLAAGEPDTPANSQSTETRDTRQIRRRVQALECQDDATTLQKETAKAEDAHEVLDGAKVVAQADKDNVEKNKSEREDDDVKAANVAEEVAETAAVLGDQDDRKQQQDEKIADVAAEVAQSAKAVDADADSPVPPSADTAVKSASPKATSFSAFSSASSPFSAVKTSASPLASSSSATSAATQETDQKPKAKATFTNSASPFASVATPSTPFAARIGSTSASDKQSAVPSTPFSKFSSTATTTTTAAGLTSTPFSAFASKSGFASASTAGGGAGTSFSTMTPKPAFGGPKSATTTSGFGSFSAATASPFASVSKVVKRDVDGAEDDAAVVDTGRKMGEAEEPDPDKKVFTEQEVITGEENDELVHSVRAKLFAMHDGSWVERGTGVLKLNATKEAEKKGARLVMRADATHRLLLNAPLFQNFSIELFQEKYVRFAVIESVEQGPTSYMLRLGSIANATNLVNAVKDKVAELS
ncbi:hypothetical protein ACM66B_000781 [Microbotryomycetes sp. NB124-2]